MAEDCTSWSVQANWIVTGDGQVFANGIMRGKGEVIEAIGAAGEITPSTNHRRLPNAAILPGLINAHAHLELSHLRNLLPRRASMPRWLMSLLRHRGSPADQLEATAQGAREALAGGTTTIADISHDNSAWRVLKDFPIRKLCLAEVLGAGPLERGAMDRLAASLVDLPPADDRMKFGISPHAPYTTSAALYRQAITLAKQRHWPVCTHLAETKAERQLLMRGGGRLLQFLKTVSLADDRGDPWACKPLEFAQRVGLLDTEPAQGESLSSLLAHVNYLDDQELDLLARGGASVVYCPGSSEFFGHRDHRYSEMLQAGVNVALGTDSLASNDSLDMLAEMRRLRSQARVDNQTILQMATLNGAKALGWSGQIGSLSAGKMADWFALKIPQYGDGVSNFNVLETILTQPTELLETVIAGQVAFTR
jgi:cytosine/adenosine deaminase-related metal-dependent hydrolase